MVDEIDQAAKRIAELTLQQLGGKPVDEIDRAINKYTELSIQERQIEGLQRDLSNLEHDMQNSPEIRARVRDMRNNDLSAIYREINDEKFLAAKEMMTLIRQKDDDSRRYGHGGMMNGGGASMPDDMGSRGVNYSGRRISRGSNGTAPANSKVNVSFR